MTGTTTPPGRSTAASRRAAASGFVGSALEYYDFFLYAQAAALIFPLVFFPADEPQAGIVAAFATFGVGYAARPLGAFVLGHWGDTQGRRNVLVLCMLTMGISTFLVGVLPTYDQVGMLAPALLVALRLVQGFAVGGEISGASAMIIEQAPEGRRGFFGSFTMQGVQAGQVIAAGAFLPLSAILSTEEFRAWGWRVPFLLSALVVAVGYVIRRRVEETAAFRAEVAAGAVLRAPLVAALTESGPDMLRVAAMVLANVIGTLVVTFGTTFATNPGYGAGFSTTQFLVIAICGNVTAVVLIPFAGRLSDRIGRRPCMIVGALGSSVLGYPFLYFIAAGDFWLTFLCAMLMWGVIFQGYQAVFAPYYLELFPTRTRVTAAAVAQSVGTLVTAFLPTLFGSLAGPTPAACVLKRTFAPAVLLPSGRTCAAAAEVAQSSVVRTVGTLTLACGVIAAVAAYTARETYRDPLPG